MTSMNNEDLVPNILKSCFPKADKMKITKNSIGEIRQYFTSDVVSLTVELEQEGKKQLEQLIMKSQKHDQTSSYYEKLDFYKRETIMYKIMIPHINSYLDSPLIPIGYYVTDSQILILENLTAQGYVTRDKCKLFTLEECYPILEALANFHAASFKVRQQHPYILNDLIFDNYPILNLNQNIIGSLEPVLCKLLERNNEYSLILKFTEAMRYLKNKEDEIRSKLNQSNFKFSVLNHGDFRINNLLLKYDTNEQVKDVKIIDYQMCTWSSPVLDIIYFFAMSVPVDVVEKNFENLVIWYLQCINGRLQKLNCPETYTMLEFMTDFRNSSPLFILFALISSAILSPLDISKLEESFFDAKEDTADYFDVCLDDELFAHSSYGWLKYCEKMGGFDALWE